MHCNLRCVNPPQPHLASFSRATKSRRRAAIPQSAPPTLRTPGHIKSCTPFFSSFLPPPWPSFFFPAFFSPTNSHLSTASVPNELLSESPRYHSAKMSPSRSPGPLRLAILEADTPQPKTNERLGGYRGVFTALLQAACDTSTPPKTLTDELALSGHDIVHDLDAYPSLDDVDAILITGSKHNSFDNDAWILKLVEYTQAALATNRVRIVGICFGHQILSRALGASVGRNPKGWELAVTEVDLTPEGKKVFGLEKMVRYFSLFFSLIFFLFVIV